MQRIFAGLVILIALAACSDKTPEASADPRNTVWGAQVKSLDKARGVEQTVQEAAERTRAADTQQGQ